MPTTKINLPAYIELKKNLSAQADGLRTPFNHITGFSKLLLNMVGNDPFPDLQKEDLGTVHQTGAIIQHAFLYQIVGQSES